MSRILDRRQFTISAGYAAAVAFLTSRGLLAADRKSETAGDRTANKPGKKGAKAPTFAIGYAAITWGDKSVKTAIDEIAAAGYPGIQLRGNITKDYKTPADLKADLDKAKLTFACLSGGSPSADPAKRAAEVEKFLTGVKFAKEAGCLTVQSTSPKPTGDKMNPEELKSFAQTLNEIGKQTAALGVPLAFHPHMGQIGQSPEAVEIILKESDPQFVKLLLDTGHWAAAGGDPVKAIKQHGKRLGMLHIKDVKDKPEVKEGKKYEFVELGQGKVDFKGVFAALHSVGFKGWTVIELDSVPAGRAPKDAALANKEFLEKSIGLAV